MPSIFVKTVKHGFLTLYEYSLDRNVYIHLSNEDKYCFGKTGNIILPNGLMDTSEISYRKFKKKRFF